MRFYPLAIRRIGRDPSLENGTEPGIIPHPPQLSIRAMRVEGKLGTQKQSKHISRMVLIANQLPIIYGHFLPMPLTVVAVYHLRRLAGGIGIGEQEFMSLSFLPKPTNCEDTGSWTVDSSNISVFLSQQ